MICCSTSVGVPILTNCLDWRRRSWLPKFLRWGHGEPLSESWVVLYVEAGTEPTAALAQGHTVAGRLEFWQGWTATLGSHNRRYVNPFVRGLRPRP